MAKDASTQVAYCAEFDSDEGEEVASTRRLAAGPSAREQANMAAKRTTDAQGSASSSPRQNSQDLASDSGYSSRTQGTSASADSGKSATPLPSIPQATAAQIAAASSEQPQPPNSKPALSRTSSKSSRRVKQCRDPDCADCKRGRMMKKSANSSQKSASKSPSKRPPPSEHTRPTSTQRSSERPLQPAATAAPQPQARPPLRSASTSRARPRSMYDAPNEPQSAGAGPPVAYYNTQRYPYQTQGYMTGAGNMMVAERPGMPHRATDPSMLSARRRPLSMAGAPVVSYDPGASQRLSARRPTKTTYPAVGVGQDEDEDEDETEESEAYDSPEEYLRAIRRRENEFQAQQARQRALKQEQDARRMPPPPQPASASGQQQYSMRTYDKTATRITYGDRVDDYDDIRNTARGLDTDFLSGGSSRARRPSLASSGDLSKGTSNSQPVPGSQRVTIQDPRTSRRQSYVGSEGWDELWAKHYDSLRLDSALQTQTLRHKRGSPDFSKDVNPGVVAGFASLDRDNQPTRYDKLSEAAMAYQRNTDRLRVPEPASLTSKNMRRHVGLPSDDDDAARSPARSNASNDGSARISARRQIKAVPSERMSMAEGEVRMRVDLSNELELEFEGRRLAIAPTGEGSIAELVIGNKRESTSYYGTSKGSLSTESRLGRSKSMRAKQPATLREREPPTPTRSRREEREPPTPTRARREVERERDDDERSTTTAVSNVPGRPTATRTKRAETYAASSRRAAEETPSESGYEPAPTKLHRRTKTQEARYEAGPSSPVSSRNKRSLFGRS